MKKLFLFVVASMVLSSPIEASNTNSQFTYPDDKCYVDSLVNEIQNGNPKAYGSLGDCYRYGRGVEKNMLNMINLYVLEKTSTGNNRLKSYCESVEEYNPVRILNDINAENVDAKHLATLNASLRTTMPLEADALDVFINSLVTDKINPNDVKKLEVLADRGSDMAVALLIVYATKQNNNDIMLPYLLRYADKYPMLLNEAGHIMWEEYKHRRNTEKVNDIALLKRAESCLIKTYNRGFIDGTHAGFLRRIYKEYDRLNISYSKSILSNLSKIYLNN